MENIREFGLIGLEGKTFVRLLESSNEGADTPFIIKSKNKKVEDNDVEGKVIQTLNDIPCDHVGGLVLHKDGTSTIIGPWSAPILNDYSLSGITRLIEKGRDKVDEVRQDTIELFLDFVTDLDLQFLFIIKERSESTPKERIYDVLYDDSNFITV